DFFEQEQHTTDQGGLRPDMIIRLPAGRDIIVDVKTPLDAFLTAVETTDEAKREQALDQHARNVQARVRELASKSYWSQFDNTPDFVVLFIPGDQFLSAALERNNDLLEYALQQRVILATPTSLVALLRAVAFGWRQEALAENADHIRQLGEELYKRLATFTEHLDKVGKNLQRSVESFNKAVGSMDRQVIPGARKLSELGIKARKELEDVKQIETQARTIEKDDS
ncbi:MAG TPA: DNA recombination protein RmuC, partial [Gammaproteobacteria bacterium]|nr:DNA recombination protein RmuC [Gammaproteobacteria bacterium]